MNWDLLMRSLSNIDPELQLKNDGVEMFHGEMCVMKVDSNEREVFFIHFHANYVNTDLAVISKSHFTLSISGGSCLGRKSRRIPPKSF